MAEVRPHAAEKNRGAVSLLRLHNSNIRSRRDEMVRVPAEARRPEEQERGDRRQSAHRPVGLRLDEHVRLPQHHGADGGLGPEEEAGGQLYQGPDQELDGVALCAGGQLQVRPVGASGPPGERGVAR